MHYWRVIYTHYQNVLLLLRSLYMSGILLLENAGLNELAPDRGRREKVAVVAVAR